MTDKQIIIDGVRVDECCYFDYENDGYEDSCYIHQNECSAQNCYYKQLQKELMLKKEIDKSLYDLIKLDNIPAHIKERVEAIWKQL